jgi:hypothetical protein
MFRLGLTFDPYSGGGSYTTEGILFYYGAMKKTLDASIDDIIAPTSDDNHFRENPVLGTPVIRIKNRGVSTITSINFMYGLKGGAMQNYKWTGSLATFADQEITLPALTALNALAGDSLVHTFVAKIVSVNGSSDADSTNNIMQSQFLSAPQWPSAIKVILYTNNEPIASGSTVSENAWVIYDRNNVAVAQRTNNQITKLYTDTVKLHTGYYRFVIYDSSCDGLAWWLLPQLGFTNGYLNIKKLSDNKLLPMRGYTYSGSYNHDFGCGYSQYFYVVDTTEGIVNVTESDMSIEAYPNPAQNTVNIDIAGLNNISDAIQIYDALGRMVSQTPCTAAHQQLSTQDLVNGVYTIFYFNAGTGHKLSTRLLIAR